MIVAYSIACPLITPIGKNKFVFLILFLFLYLNRFNLYVY